MIPTTSNQDFISITDRIFLSNSKLSESQRSMPVYCNPDDFFLLPYCTSEPPSDDFVIRESKSGDELYASITYFDNQGNPLLTEELAYSTKRRIYPNVHLENVSVTYKTQNSLEPKQYEITPMSRTMYYLEHKYNSYQAAIDAGNWAIYYSKPVLFE